MTSQWPQRRNWQSWVTLGRGRCPQRSGGTDEPPPPNSCRQCSWRCWVPGPQERLQDVHSPASQLWAGPGRGMRRGCHMGEWGSSLGWGPPEDSAVFSIWSLGCRGAGCCLWDVNLSNLILSPCVTKCRVQLRSCAQGASPGAILCSITPLCGPYSLWGARRAVAGFRGGWGSGTHSTAVFVQFLS